VKLTVLGNAGRYLAPLTGGTSYLVEHGETRVLLDAGQGARVALAAQGVERLDAVVLSHFHFDHVLDFVTLLPLLDERSVVVIPPGERARLGALAKAYAFQGDFDMPCDPVEAREPLGVVPQNGAEKAWPAGHAGLAVGALRLAFAPTQHSAPSFATRIGGLVYASDTASCHGLRALARDAELLLMHTLLPTVEATSHHARAHSTAETAGALAAEVGAKRLLLSHRYHESPDAAMREAASAHHEGVELAREGEAVEIRG